MSAQCPKSRCKYYIRNTAITCSLIVYKEHCTPFILHWNFIKLIVVHVMGERCHNCWVVVEFWDVRIKWNPILLQLSSKPAKYSGLLLQYMTSSSLTAIVESVRCVRFQGIQKMMAMLAVSSRNTSFLHHSFPNHWTDLFVPLFNLRPEPQSWWKHWLSAKYWPGWEI